MSFGNPIQVRLSREKRLAYEEEAARQDKPLGTYLRERLEADDVLRGELAAIRHDVAVGVSELRRAVEEGRGSAPSEGLPLETLLLLRAVAGPERVKLVQAELRRL